MSSLSTRVQTYCYGVTMLLIIITVLYIYVFNKACAKHYTELTGFIQSWKLKSSIGERNTGKVPRIQTRVTHFLKMIF